MLYTKSSKHMEGIDVNFQTTKSFCLPSLPQLPTGFLSKNATLCHNFIKWFLFSSELQITVKGKTKFFKDWWRDLGKTQRQTLHVHVARFRFLEKGTFSYLPSHWPVSTRLLLMTMSISRAPYSTASLISASLVSRGVCPAGNPAATSMKGGR